MFQKLMIVMFAPILMSGCDDSATEISREAANRQAQQNTAMAELNKEVTRGTQRLVEADSQTRKEIVGVHHELQAERTRLDTRWEALEQERRQIAGERRTESMLVPISGLLLATIVLGFCWYALAAVRHDDGNDAQLNELLIHEILPDETPLLTSSQPMPSLISNSAPEPPAKG